jgi:hypothetical protein
VGGVAFLDGCVLGFPGCSDENPCPVHPQRMKLREFVPQMLTQRTVEELAAELGSKVDFLQGENLFTSFVESHER